VLACIGFAGGLVFYNAFLPVIATPEKYDIVSAKGYSLGYIGSVILLIFNLVTITFPDLFGFQAEVGAVKLSFILVGTWWIGFAQIPFYILPSNKRSGIDYSNIIKRGYQEIIQVWKSARQNKMLKRFLLSFFFYSTGVQTVMYLAALFGDKELNMPGNKLILTILIIQIVAVGGSYLFARLSERKGNIFSLSIMVFIWIIICLYAYFVTNEFEFYFLATVVGLVMGGIQSLSRATYSKLIPSDTIDQTSYFSFYDVLEKVAIVLGTFSYAFIEQLTGSMRNSAVTLGLFFLVGIAFLRLVKIPEEPFRFGNDQASSTSE
jgi:UMF1 family MFS transporter